MSMPPGAVMRPDERQGPVILGATLTVTIAALITTVARLYVRAGVIRNVGWDVSASVDRTTSSADSDWVGLCHDFSHGLGKLS